MRLFPEWHDDEHLGLNVEDFVQIFAGSDRAQTSRAIIREATSYIPAGTVVFFFFPLLLTFVIKRSVLNEGGATLLQRGERKIILAS